MFCASQWASQKSLSLLLLCLIPDLPCISLGSHGCAVCAWEKSSLKNQPPEPWLWWMQRDPHSHQQHHSTMLSSASPGFRGKTSKKIFFIFSVCAYNSFPWVTLLPCYMPTIKASLACWDPAHRNVLLVLLWISLQLDLWHFYSNSSFFRVQHLDTNIVLHPHSSLWFFVTATLFSVQRALGTAAAIPPGYSFLPQSGCWEAAGVLQPHNFCLCRWPKTSWVFSAYRCAWRSVSAAHTSHRSTQERLFPQQGFKAAFLFLISGISTCSNAAAIVPQV